MSTSARAMTARTVDDDLATRASRSMTSPKVGPPGLRCAARLAWRSCSRRARSLFAPTAGQHTAGSARGAELGFDLVDEVAGRGAGGIVDDEAGAREHGEGAAQIARRAEAHGQGVAEHGAAL